MKGVRVHREGGNRGDRDRGEEFLGGGGEMISFTVQGHRGG